MLTEWCGREDSNFHGLSATTTSTLRVYQFRHDRTSRRPRRTPGRWQAAAPSRGHWVPQCPVGYAPPSSPAKVTLRLEELAGTSTAAPSKPAAAPGASRATGRVMVQR